MLKKTWLRIIIVLVVLAAVLGVYFRYLHARVLTALIRAPYPASGVIRGFSLNWDSLQRLAPGSGDWPITWADDDNQYTIWGNGGGFGGTDSDGRVYMGFGRIEGPKDNYQAFNVWGGKDAEESGPVWRQILRFNLGGWPDLYVALRHELRHR